MGIAPWYKFYAADYLLDADVDALPLEAQAILVRMWAVLWIEGELKNDAIDIARKCRVDVLHVHVHLQKLLHFFQQTEFGTLVSIRMEKERTKSGHVSVLRSKAAKLMHDKQVAAHAHAKPSANHDAKVPAKPLHSESDTDTDIRTRTKPSPAKPERQNTEPLDALPQESQHKRIHAMIMNAYKDQNGLECPWDGGEARQLSDLIKATTFHGKPWPDSSFAQCLQNMYASAGIPKGRRPREFLPRLPKYLNGPLNEFDREVGNGNQKQFSKATTRDREILERAVRSAKSPATGATPGESADPLEVPRNGGT